MMDLEITNVTSIENSTFYNERYKAGYMEDWDFSKKKKIIEVTKSLNLPPKGKALDFGCGNGVLTNLLKEILPSWEVYGFEISDTAIINAKKYYKNCHFLSLHEITSHEYTFDFIFSHHVLEHVENIDSTFKLIKSLSNTKTTLLHILPCGNKNSFEYNLCNYVNDGIDIKNGRFFFEEPGHLRRLTTMSLTETANKSGFELYTSFYSNQYFGAIDWITKSSPRFIYKLTNTNKSKSKDSKNKLTTLRMKLLFLCILQFPYSKYYEYKIKRTKNSKRNFILILLAIPAFFSKLVYKMIGKKAEQEWKRMKHNDNGSEMFAIYKSR